ncbi:MAG: fumarylacetoacetate hydrolase family protein [Verrucomicrobiota bacterium]|nr:fumarylacetoacetate hydrolase family protein [Verrucomicrobiota bacterium]
MRIIRYQDSDGKIDYASEQTDGTAFIIEGDILGEYKVSTQKANVCKLLAPIIPSSIFCIGLNYKLHAQETNAKIPEVPVVFMKGINTIQNPGDPILLPTHLKSEQVDYECELAIVIGKAAKNVKKEDALKYVLGYTCANDVSARDWQIKFGGTQWCQGKTFDTFCPIGPAIVTIDEIPHPNDLSIKTIVSGKTLQDWNTNDMIFDVPTIIEFLSGSKTLLPGTLILTGTPHGVGMARNPKRWLKQGDTVTIEIGKIGTLNNPVLNE